MSENGRVRKRMYIESRYVLKADAYRKWMYIERSRVSEAAVYRKRLCNASDHIRLAGRAAGMILQNPGTAAGRRNGKDKE